MQWLRLNVFLTVPVRSLFLNTVKVVAVPVASGDLPRIIFRERRSEKVTVARAGRVPGLIPTIISVVVQLMVQAVLASRLYHPGGRSCTTNAAATHWGFLLKLSTGCMKESPFTPP